MKKTLLALVCAFVVTYPVRAAEKISRDLVISAGKHDRHQVPVRVAVTLPHRGGWYSETLQTADGKSIPAQLTGPSMLVPITTSKPAFHGELHFILPSLKAGETLKLKATFSTDPAPKTDGFRWHDTPGQFTELRFGDRPVMRYMYKALDESSKENRELTNKVFHHLYDPSGQRLVTNGPGGRYPHHRGLYYGFRICEYGESRADTWHCPPEKYQGHQAHAEFLTSDVGPVVGRHCVAITWHGTGNKVFAKEKREVAVYNVPGGQLVEFTSQLRSTVDRVKLSGDPQHCGFQFRADNEVADKTSKETYFLRPDGAGKPGTTRNWSATEKSHANLPWNAMSFVLGRQRYTAAYLDKPTNPKPARYSERDYGRFGSDFEYEMTAQKPLAVNYRIWLQGGEMTVDGVAAQSANFVDPVEVTVK